ncbi:hypothetical protein GOP47_0004375 [Adiantum capillus-veneris]|uniref:Uncharacterized protein n=1 Tax=Adiantum capillus-veneris TaxID=13818 RepID=A0A9D4V960_ADICA|nr:hypothetical protein GOP47_0004375 [Adiantum capillus-veneris]
MLMQETTNEQDGDEALLRKVPKSILHTGNMADEEYSIKKGTEDDDEDESIGMLKVQVEQQEQEFAVFLHKGTAYCQEWR